MLHSKLNITMNRCAIVLIVVCTVFVVNVFGDVSSLNGVKTFASTTSSSSPENSDSFSILTKEFLNKPDATLGNRISQRPSGNDAAASASASARESENGVTDNNLPDSDESDDRQAYYYDKPKIPFEFESTNIHTNTVPPKNDDLEDFDGYQYPKPAIPFPLPSTTTSNPDAETVPTDSARLRKG